NEDDFRKAVDNNFTDIQKLLAPHTNSSTSDITVNSFGKQTQAGNYDVLITTQPRKGYFAGAAMDAGVTFPNFDTAGKDYSFTLNVNGVETNAIQIPTDVVYSSATDLVAAMQASINADAKLKENGISVVVAHDSDTNAITFTSSRYGTSSWVDVVSASADAMTDLG